MVENAQINSFEEIVAQNERRIHYKIHKLRINEPYQAELFVIWNAYRKYQPDNGVLSTYFNFSVHNRLIDLIRKTAKQLNADQMVRGRTKEKGK